MSIVKQFEKMGARCVVSELSPRWGRIVRINILRDKRGEYFDIQVKEGADLQVVECRPDLRHLLLMSKDKAARAGLPDIKDKFLCGHDERHWFVAAAPGAPATVERAMEMLKPAAIRDMETKIRKKKRNKRHNEARKRQGEWFFVPAQINPDPRLILFNEPISRGRGKPHVCEELYRSGGDTVWTCFQYPNGVTEKEYQRLIKGNDRLAKANWRMMRRNPAAYVRGKISHPDHATIVLAGWHRIYMNEENRARGMSGVAFLD